MIKTIITCITTIICMLGITHFIEQHNTNEIVTIESQRKSVIIYNTYESYNDTNKYEYSEQVTEEVIIEERMNMNASDKSHLEINEINNNNTGRKFRSTLECEVCERSGVELEVWRDVNGIEHCTCKEKCTNGLEVLYGR